MNTLIYTFFDTERPKIFFFSVNHTIIMFIVVQCTRTFCQSNFGDEFDFVLIENELNVLYIHEEFPNRVFHMI